VNNAKTLLRILHEQYPNAKVKMMGIQLPSVNGGTGQSYGASSQYANWYGLVRAVMNMNLAYQAMANEDEFKDYVEFINISGQFDSENNMPRQTKPVNTRSTLTEQVGTNGVHPSTDGYYQIGDAAYRALVPELTE
jgi:lysophospholipase L1-like esterase